MSILEEFSLGGRRALVTGGSGELGGAMAGALADAGASVVVVGRTAPDRTMPSMMRVTCDLSTPDGCEEAVRAGLDLLGGLDILVTAHGTSEGRGPSLEVSSADWEAVMATNLASVFTLCRLAGAVMIPQGSGKIVTVASMLSFFGGLRAAAYAASKGGVAQLTRSLANEWAPLGVNVNAIAPGFMKTRLTAHVWGDPARFEQTLGRIPAGRWGEPSDLRGVTVFLASRASDYLHGAIIPVDGGYLSR
jgi:2-dehydro-3-deoxy-D-gluconate 5-dehydrogenase